MTAFGSYNQSGGGGSFNPNIDNAGKQEVSINFGIGEYVLDHDLAPDLLDTQVVNGGTVSYDATKNSASLDVTAASGDVAIIGSKQFHPYYPGHAQQVQFTFIGLAPQTDVIKRIGYFSSTTVSPFDSSKDGFYLESSGGAVSLVISKGGTATTIPQSAWLDPLDGTGSSSLTVDWNNFQVFMIDFLYLGGTTVNLYWITNGRRHLVNQHHHANNFADVIMDYPSQPVRAEIRSTGGAGSFDFTCAQVSTQINSFNFNGIPFCVDSGNDTINLPTAGTEYPILGLRKSDRHWELFKQDVTIISSAGTNHSYRWRLLKNPTLSADLTWGSSSVDGVEYAVGNGVITVSDAGHEVAAGVGVARSSGSLAISQALRPGCTIDGTFDELILAITPFSNSQDVGATINSIRV